MKVIIFAVLLACACAAPLEDGIDISPSDNVNVIVNGVPEGEALEIGHLLDIKVQEHSNGALVAANNVLEPLTAAAIAEAAAAAVISEPGMQDVVQVADFNIHDTDSAVLPAPVVLPEAATPEVVIPESVSLPEAVLPEGIALPEPVVPEIDLTSDEPQNVIPVGVALPAPATPEVVEVGTPVVVPGLSPEIVVPGLIPEIVEIVIPEPATPELILETVDLPVDGDLYNDGVVQVQVNLPEDQGILTTLSSWMSLAISYMTGGVQNTNQIV